MKTNNPFKVLGLDADLLRELRDDQIQILIKSQYRLLQGMFHPDKCGGDNSRSRELNRARDLIDKESEYNHYSHYKEQYLKRIPHQKKVEELTALVAQEKMSFDRLYEVLLAYFRFFSQTGAELTVLNLYAYQLQMNDTSIAHHIPITFSKKNRRTAAFYSLLVRKGGEIVKKRADGTTESYSDKVLIGCIDQHTATSHSGISSIINMVQSTWTAAQQLYARIDATHEERRKRAMTQLTSQEIKPFGERMAPENFKRIVHLLTPRVAPSSYLFSLNSDREGQWFFSLEGSILSIEPIG